MSYYGGVKSPALVKMEGYGSRNDGLRPPRRRFAIGRVAGDPFALATLGMALLGWILSFVASIVSDVEKPFPNFVWWTLVYMLMAIIGIFIVYAADAVHTYHVAVTGFCAVGLVYTSSEVNQLIYSTQGAFDAAGAGFLLQSMVTIIWMFYFGSQAQSSPRAYIDSFALYKHTGSPRASRQMTNRYMEPSSTAYAPNAAPNVYSANHLNGFETSALPQDYSNNSAQNHLSGFGTSDQSPSVANQFSNPEQPQEHDGNVEPGENDVSYPHRARAIYSYEANPDDPNEISFQKHEELEISDVSGKWWQTRKQNGETGIAPSNYLILLDV